MKMERRHAEGAARHTGALHDAYKGKLDLEPAHGENLARATWTR